MKKFLFGLILFAGQFLDLRAQNEGCTDPQASNFSKDAKKNNGSCVYAPVSFTPFQTVSLSASLKEWSGMVYWKGLYWGHNDGGNGAWLYAADTLNGMVKKVISLKGAANTDWEDIAQDSLNFFIGDFGNNANGNRTNLRIYIVPKQYLLGNSDTLTVESNQYSILQFQYPDQTSFVPAGANNTRFDCEAMFFHRGRLHLFTKNWTGNFTVHYSLPPVAGSFQATRHDSLNTGGFLITAADIGAEDQFIMTAYSRTGSCAFFLIYGFDSTANYFEKANKRRIDLPTSFQIGQLEAVCYINGIRGAMGSEGFFSVPQNISRFSSQNWVVDHYRNNPVLTAEAGMMRFNNEKQQFEYFNGQNWVELKGGD